MGNFDDLYKAQKANLNNPINTDVKIPQSIREKVCETLLDAIHKINDIEKIEVHLTRVFGSKPGPKELDTVMGLMAANKLSEGWIRCFRNTKES